jgi:hypothetical protein
MFLVVEEQQHAAQPLGAVPVRQQTFQAAQLSTQQPAQTKVKKCSEPSLSNEKMPPT